MINRLVEPTSGRIRIDGEDTAAMPGHELRRRIGYAIQGHGLFPHRTVGAEHRHRARRCSAGTRREIDARVDELLDAVPARSGRVRAAVAA